jgi:uncharacterized membrane protein YfcA
MTAGPAVELAAYVLGMLALGAGVGVMSAGLGLGGGILMVPAFLTFVPGMDEHTATGTSLFVILFVALVNAWRLNAGLPDTPWRLAAWLSVGAMAGGYLGKWSASLLPARAVAGFFLLFLVLVGVRTFLLAEPRVRDEDVHRRRAAAAGIGLVAGFVGGGTGTGGGAVLVPLTLLAGLVTNARAVALSNMVMVATSAAAALAAFQAPRIHDGLWTVGQVELSLAPFVFIGAQLGSLAGVRLNAALSLPRRRVVMGLILLLIAVRVSGRLLA